MATANITNTTPFPLNLDSLLEILFKQAAITDHPVISQEKTYVSSLGDKDKISTHFPLQRKDIFIQQALFFKTRLSHINDQFYNIKHLFPNESFKIIWKGKIFMIMTYVSINIA